MKMCVAIPLLNEQFGTEINSSMKKKLCDRINGGGGGGDVAATTSR